MATITVVVGEDSAQIVLDAPDAEVMANLERLMIRRGDQPSAKLSQAERVQHVLGEAIAEWIRHTEQEAAQVRVFELKHEAEVAKQTIEDRAHEQTRLWTRPARVSEEVAEWTPAHGPRPVGGLPA